MVSLDMKEKDRLNYDQRIDSIISSDKKIKVTQNQKVLHKSFVNEMAKQNRKISEQRNRKIKTIERKIKSFNKNHLQKE